MSEISHEVLRGVVDTAPDAQREKVRELPVLTVYVLRHGQTSEDKSNPNRGLTSLGEEQIRDSAKLLMKELDPDRDLIQFLDSGSNPKEPRAKWGMYRTRRSNDLVSEALADKGFKYFAPIKVNADGKPVNAGVSVQETARHRVLSSVGEPTFTKESKRKQANKDKSILAAYGIPADIEDPRLAMWYALAESKELDVDSDTPGSVLKRVQEGMEKAAKSIPMLARQLRPDQRIVSIVNANGPQIDTVITELTGKGPAQRQGGVENAQGFKIDFFGPNKIDIQVWPENN